METEIVAQGTAQAPEPKAELKVEVKPEVKAEVKPDLITRVSQFKEALESGEAKKEEVGFDVKDIEKITDPQAKEYAEKAYKSFQKGFNDKFQNLAEIRKEYEKKLTEDSNWTPQRIQKLLNDPAFVQAASQVVQTQNPTQSGLTDEQWSALSDSDKNRIKSMQNEIEGLKQQNYQTLKSQQDEQLKGKYANYASDIVDTTINKLVKQEAIATREDVWKVVDYENAVKRAYELGKKDKEVELKGNVSHSLPNGVNTREFSKVLPPEKGESDRGYFKRIAEKNLADALASKRT